MYTDVLDCMHRCDRKKPEDRLQTVAIAAYAYASVEE